MKRNPECLKAVRTRIGEAEEQLQIACKTLRRNGWVDTADELSRELRLLRMFTKPDGHLDALNKPDWPDDWPEIPAGRGYQEARGVKPCGDA